MLFQKIRRLAGKVILIGSVVAIADLLVSYLFEVPGYDDNRMFYIFALSILTIYLYQKHGSSRA